MINDQHIPKELEQMLFDFYMTHGRKKYTSDWWVNHINNPRIAELLKFGYRNFRHTLAISYCAWYDDPASPQTPLLTQAKIEFLINNLSPKQVTWAQSLAQKFPRKPNTVKESNLITLFLWQYLKNQGLKRQLRVVNDSSEGNPPTVNLGDKLFSRGLAHTLLEYDTVRQHVDIESVKSVMEIGPGYGRTTQTYLRLHPTQKHILVDFPPALYIAQRYLSSLFPEKKIFKYRQFDSFKSVQPEYETADIIFLMPWQIETIPHHSIDLVIAINCFDYLNMGILKKYLKYIGLLGKKFFYLKSWKERRTETGRKIRWGHLPIPPNWQCLVNRECRVLTDFFESLYQLPPPN